MSWDGGGSDGTSVAAGAVPPSSLCAAPSGTLQLCGH